MPQRPFDTKANFDSAYRIGAEPGGYPNTRPEIRLNYHRAVLLPVAEARADALVRLFDWPRDTTIVVVGAAFGWLIEVLEDKYGYTNILGTDTSFWVQQSQNSSEESEIDTAIFLAGLNPRSGPGQQLKQKLHTPGNRRRTQRQIINENMASQGSRNRIRALLGDVQIAISEDVLPSLTDNEISELGAHMEELSPVWYHLVTTERGAQDPGFNWKSLEEYKTILPQHTFISVGDWQVL